MASKIGVLFAACVVLCAHAQPVKPPVLQETPKEVLFRESKPFELDCAVEGDQNGVTYEWTKDDKPFKAGGRVEQREGKLAFSSAKTEDEGSYECFANSAAGKASTRPISVRRAYLNAPKVVPQSIKPVEGKPFKLSCDIPDAYPRPTIEWRNKTEDGMDEQVADGRITIGPEGALYFSNATQQDVSSDFTYVCVAKSPAVEGVVPLAEYTVEPLAPNNSPDNELVQQLATPDQYTLMANKPAYLYCIYGGSPFAHPDWFKDDVNVNNTPYDRVTRYNRSWGKRLSISHVLLVDQGTYACDMDNGLGKRQRYEFHVNVVSAPKLVKKPEKRTQVREGSDVFIECEVEAKPAAASEWSYNAAEIENPRVTTNAKGLTITKVQKGDSGYYGCRAENEHGEEYAETHLRVI